MSDAPKTAVPHVLSAIADISAELAKEGIGKTRKNQQQNYQFRGIDDVMVALAPLLAKHRLLILPNVTEQYREERETKVGGVLFYARLTVQFSFVSAIDGSRETVTTVGEAMDSADKASNKAQSAAYKYATILTFCIPVEGTPDADAETPDVRGRTASTIAAPPKPTPPKPPSVREWLRDALAKCASKDDVTGVGDAPLVKKALKEASTEIKQEIVNMLGEAYGRFVTPTEHDPETGEVTPDPDPDREWADGIIRQLTSDRITFAQCQALGKDPLVRKTMVGYKKMRPDLFGLVDDAFAVAMKRIDEADRMGA